MPTLGYGLNITKKVPSLANRPSPPKRKTIFDDDDDDDARPEDTPATANGAEEIHVIGGLTSTPPPNKPTQQSDPNPNPPKPKPLPTPTTSLSASHTSHQHASTATTLSPTIYDYDAIYDTLHPTPHQTHPSSDPSARQPKYMAHLLAAAETRKRDALRAKEKMLVREREAEGAEFADKEKFVTGAYVAQQAEVRRAEEEESRREREEEVAGRGKGMVGFYRGVLERGERRHAAVVDAAEEGVKGGGEVEAEGGEERVKSEAEVVGELNARGKGVVVNDEGQVVDKRQLLSAGLNVAPKPKAAASATSSGKATSRVGVESQFQGRGGSKQAMRERQTRMLEAQLEQVTKRAVDDEEGQKMELERAAKSRKTEGDISSARERYLQRKREAAAGKAP